MPSPTSVAQAPEGDTAAPSDPQDFSRRIVRALSFGSGSARAAQRKNAAAVPSTKIKRSVSFDRTKRDGARPAAADDDPEPSVLDHVGEFLRPIVTFELTVMESAERYREWANVHGHDGRAAAVLQRGWQQKRQVDAARAELAGRRAARDGDAATALQDAFRRARLRRDAKAQLAEAKRRHMLLVLFMRSELKAAHAMQRAYFRFADRKRHGAAATIQAGWRGRGGRAAAAARRRRRDHDERRRQRELAIAAAFARGEARAALIIQRHGRLLLGRLTERRAAAIRKVHEDRMAEKSRQRAAAERAARREREAMLRAEEKLRAAHDDGAAARRAAEADRALMQRPLQRRALAWPHRWQPMVIEVAGAGTPDAALVCAPPAKKGAGRPPKGERRVPLERVRHAAALDPEACRFGVTVEGVVWELRAESEAAMGAWLRALGR